MKADAPARAARPTHSGEEYAVTTATTAAGATRRIWLVAASPSSPGIWMSMTTMSCCSRAAAATPSEALKAVPTQRRPGTLPRAAASISAKEWWSSTTSTVLPSGSSSSSTCAHLLLRVSTSVSMPNVSRVVKSPPSSWAWSAAELGHRQQTTQRHDRAEDDQLAENQGHEQGRRSAADHVGRATSVPVSDGTDGPEGDQLGDRDPALGGCPRPQPAGQHRRSSEQERGGGEEVAEPRE